jgi:syntaxin 16
LNNLVIEQGSLIDRIDVNIEQTYEHTVKAVAHLEVANEHASSAFADKVIKVLVIMIISMAFVLGLKYMN